MPAHISRTGSQQLVAPTPDGCEVIPRPFERVLAEEHDLIASSAGEEVGTANGGDEGRGKLSRKERREEGEARNGGR